LTEGHWPSFGSSTILPEPFKSQDGDSIDHDA
jgi:hypothetical protein